MRAAYTVAQEKEQPGPLVETLRRAKSAFFEAMQRGFTVGVPELLNRHLLTADALAAEAERKRLKDAATAFRIRGLELLDAAELGDVAQVLSLLALLVLSVLALLVRKHKH